MNIDAIIGNATDAQLHTLAVESLTNLKTDDATAAIVEYADAELGELIETLTDELQNS